MDFSEIKKFFSSPMKILNLITALATLSYPFIALFKHRPDSTLLFNFIFLSVLLISGWALLITREFQYSRKAKYAEGMQNIHLAFHKLRDAYYSFRENDSTNTILEILHDSLKNLTEGFSLVSGVYCRGCIKELVYPESDISDVDYEDLLKAEVLLRHENIMSNKNETVSVRDNTDYKELLKTPDKNFFFSNDLSRRRPYYNSHFTEEMYATGKGWPYYSTIVFPIRKKLTKGINCDSSHIQYDCLGFLCIDTKARGAFRERYDVEMGAAYADAFYIIFRLLKDRENQQPGNHNPTKMRDEDVQ